MHGTDQRIKSENHPMDNFKNDLAGYRRFLLEESPLPLYYQVAHLLEHYIEEKELQDDDAFFSEETIATALSVSRPTVSRAVKMLIKNGLLERLRGRGTIVRKARRVPIALMSELISYGQMLSRMGMSFQTVLIERKMETASAQVAAKLNLSSGEPVIHLKRLRSAENEPLMVVDSFLPGTRFAQLMDIEAPRYATDLYQLLWELYNEEVVKAKREVTASRMSLEDAQLLQVELWEPCLRMTGVASSASGIMVEAFDSRLIGNKCVFISTLKRRPALSE
jgi:DNA-binding GntR family transcriptional regulator